MVSTPPDSHSLSESPPYTPPSAPRTLPAAPNIPPLSTKELAKLNHSVDRPDSWVFKKALACIVDFTVCYEELVEKYWELKRTHAIVQADHQRLDRIVQQIALQVREVGATERLETLASVAPVRDDDDKVSRPAEWGRRFLQEFGEPEDIDDVNFGPDCRRRNELEWPDSEL